MAAISNRPIKEGWLLKEGGATRNKWQARWFVLRGDTLFYYSKKEDLTNPQGAINLTEIESVTKIGEHSGKPHCLAIDGVKGTGKKVYYLSSEHENILTEWLIALKATISEKSLKLMKYCTAEVFLNCGIRVNGDVCYQILSALSMRTPPERKSRDHLGWFCNREIALSTVLNIFAQYNWNPEKIYRSSAIIPSESGIHPVIRIIFSKCPTGAGNNAPNNITKSFHHSTSLDKSVEGGEGEEKDPEYATVGGCLLEGTDDELISLMQEFNIPLTLLQISSNSE